MPNGHGLAGKVGITFNNNVLDQLARSLCTYSSFFNWTTSSGYCKHSFGKLFIVTFNVDKCVPIGKEQVWELMERLGNWF